jgi:hypothetical protein
VIDVERLPADNERRHGFHAGLLRFGDAGFLLSEVNDLEIVAIAIERLRYLRFRNDADRTTSVVEYGLSFHVSMMGCSAGVNSQRPAILPRRTRPHNRALNGALLSADVA